MPTVVWLIIVVAAFLIGFKCAEAENAEISEVDSLTQKTLLDVHTYFSGKPSLTAVESRLFQKLNNLKEIF